VTRCLGKAAILLCLVSSEPALAAAPHVQPQIAAHRLDFSGALISVREEFPRGWPIARRTFSLSGANGQKRQLPLHEGGGTAGNQSLNLFKVADDRYLIISEKDCVEFDPVRITARYCAHRPPCAGQTVSNATYLGRFDWMNGYDPPKGVFRLGFRYLGFDDAVEDGSCPRQAADVR
jgi:hypothetical protein